MTHWHDTMVDRPETDGAVYVTGWTISGVAVLGTVVAVWVSGFSRDKARRERRATWSRPGWTCRSASSRTARRSYRG